MGRMKQAPFMSSDGLYCKAEENDVLIMRPVDDAEEDEVLLRVTPAVAELLSGSLEVAARHARTA